MKAEEQNMPCAIEAEKSVLGAILLDNEAYPEAASLLMPEEFHLDAHRRIFTAIVEVIEGGAACDLITLTNELGRRKEIEAIGGVAYLSSLTDCLPRLPSIASYCKIVRDKYRRRQLIHACQTGMAAAYENSETTPECLSIIEDKLLGIRANDVHSTLHSIRDVMPEVIERLRDEAEGRCAPGLSYGLTELDLMAGVMRPGELIVIGGQPGRGKTAMTVQIISANAPQGVPCVDFTPEMSRWQLAKRMLPANSLVPAARIREPSSLRDDWSEVLKTADKLMKWPLWIDDSATITLQELTSRAKLGIKQHRKQQGRKADNVLVLVDYLRLVKARGKDTRERVSNVAEGCRQLAKSEDVTVVLLSQLARGSDINERPTMQSLKESGDIEAAAHVVILPYTPEDQESRPTGDDELIVAKCREGNRGSVPVYFDKRRLQFVAREVTR